MCFPFNHLLLREPARSVMFGKHQNLAKKCALTNYIYMSRSVFHTLGNLAIWNLNQSHVCL